jgi:hypothetical protein
MVGKGRERSVSENYMKVKSGDFTEKKYSGKFQLSDDEMGLKLFLPVVI